jgi:hypothetical protein
MFGTNGKTNAGTQLYLLVMLATSLLKNCPGIYVGVLSINLKQALAKSDLFG